MVNTLVNTVNAVSQVGRTFHEDLITEFSKHGLEITPDEIPNVLKLGADTFLKRHQVDVPEKKIEGLYLILNEMRNNN